MDAGGGKKLERWGDIITIRPEVQAYFRSGKPFEEWYALAHWEYISKAGKSVKWKSLKDGAPEHWAISYNGLKFNLKLTNFKHLGLFPEQKINWDFITDHLNPGGHFLNLFAYTGAASVFAKNNGMDVIHVDSVKQLITWANENMVTSCQEGIRWVHEDALKFLKREVKRGNKYEALIMDPPAWGIGAKKEKWKIEDKIDDLLSQANEVVREDGTIILNTYSPKLSLSDLKQIASLHLSKRKFDAKELWMKTNTGKELFYGNLLRSSVQ